MDDNTKPPSGFPVVGGVRKTVHLLLKLTNVPSFTELERIMEKWGEEHPFQIVNCVVRDEIPAIRYAIDDVR